MNKNTDNYHYGYEQEKDQVETITNKLNVLSKHERLSSPLPVQPSLNDHCHEYSTVSSNIDKSARRKLILASGLCLFFMTGEIIGGALAHSLAIMTDTAHLLTDFASFLISLLALFLASRPSTKRMSFGWHRAEVVGALASVLLIWLVTGILVYLAVIRIIHNNYEINGKIMLITSATGVGVNIIMLFTLHNHGHNHTSLNEHSNELPKPTITTISNHNHNHKYDINNEIYKELNRPNITVRSAYIHVIGDLLQSIGVMITAMVIYFQPKYKIIDPLCTFLFSILVLITTLNILRDALNVLMEATPRGLNFNEVKSSLMDIPGVREIHNLHIWSLTTNKTAVSVHLAIENDSNTQEILKQANYLLKQRYLAHDVTIQLELYVEEMANCYQCKEPLK
uniref:Cation efflux protein/ zinc transporter,putative n=1 Tax=Schistosoma mansoni TaxID=6183 RepID=A0A5K4EWQ4_SCHMA